ncbi:hypothetical protein [Cutibacterium sp. V947]|uniref:hypothetical protein n=1 Tax=Cutibacterium sp. V947 TaxID=3446480 RepID=UPI003EDF537A
MKKFRALGASLVATGLLASAPLAAQAADTEPPARPDHDLSVMYSVSPLKKPGHPGLVALHVSNVGTKNYYAPLPVVQFIVKVHTVSGPTDVNRVITPKGYNGATVTDLGFDESTSTRTFRVILANGLRSGENQVVANFNFADGQTRHHEGRIVQEITTSQVGRLPNDTTTRNDQDINSQKWTWNDMNHRQNAGLF